MKIELALVALALVAAAVIVALAVTTSKGAEGSGDVIDVGDGGSMEVALQEYAVGSLRVAAAMVSALGLDPSRILNAGVLRAVGNVVSDDGSSVDISGQFTLASARAAAADASGRDVGASARLSTALALAGHHMSRGAKMMGLRAPMLSEISCTMTRAAMVLGVDGDGSVYCSYTTSDGAVMRSAFSAAEVAAWDISTFSANATSTTAGN